MVAVVPVSCPTLAQQDYTDLASIGAQYGALGLMSVGLAALHVWMEKNRRKDDMEDRKERDRYFDSLIDVIHQKDKIIEQKDCFIQDLIKRDK